MSEIINLTEESIAAYKELLMEPAKHGLSFRPILECFEKSETVTPQHILFNEFIAYLQKPLPKVFFYIIMEELYGGQVNAGNGDLGFLLKFKPE